MLRDHDLTAAGKKEATRLRALVTFAHKATLCHDYSFAWLSPASRVLALCFLLVAVLFDFLTSPKPLKTGRKSEVKLMDAENMMRRVIMSSAAVASGLLVNCSSGAGSD